MTKHPKKTKIETMTILAIFTLKTMKPTVINGTLNQKGQQPSILLYPFVDEWYCIRILHRCHLCFYDPWQWHSTKIHFSLLKWILQRDCEQDLDGNWNFHIKLKARHNEFSDFHPCQDRFHEIDTFLKTFKKTILV